MSYLYAKIFHLVGMVTWMAGLFYLPRLFVYHAEAQERAPVTTSGDAPGARGVLEAQFTIMEQRLLGIITTPAMLMTWIGGLFMLHLSPALLTQRWMLVKLALLVALSAYHGWMAGVVKRLARGEHVMSGERFRIMNEVPTVALVLICTYAVLRDSVGLVTGVAISAVMVVVLAVGIQLYSVVRRRKAASP